LTAFAVGTLTVSVNKNTRKFTFSGSVDVRFSIACLAGPAGMIIPKAVRDWLPALKASIARALVGSLSGSGCSGSFSRGVLLAVSSIGVTIGNIPYLGAELKLTNRFLTGMICADDQQKFSNCRLGQSVFLTAAVYAFGMGREYVIQLEPMMSPACGNRQLGFGSLAMGFIGTGWDADDGYSYNMYESSFCRCI
jgi:hypothetical protein